MALARAITHTHRHIGSHGHSHRTNLDKLQLYIASGEVLLLLEQDGCVRTLVTVVPILVFLSGETINTYFFNKTSFSAEQKSPPEPR